MCGFPSPLRFPTSLLDPSLVLEVCWLVVAGISQRTAMAASMRAETLVESRGAVEHRNIGRSMIGAAILLSMGVFGSITSLNFYLQEMDPAGLYRRTILLASHLDHPSPHMPVNP